MNWQLFFFPNNHFEDGIINLSCHVISFANCKWKLLIYLHIDVEFIAWYSTHGFCSNSRHAVHAFYCTNWDGFQSIKYHWEVDGEQKTHICLILVYKVGKIYYNQKSRRTLCFIVCESVSFEFVCETMKIPKTTVRFESKSN